MGVFARIMDGLAADSPEHKTIMIDVSRGTSCVRESLRKYLKAHRTASSLRLKEGAWQADRAEFEDQETIQWIVSPRTAG
ncbi:hypothetical protein LX81_01862 [Palleronia aestuarii]|uniref:Uncharacterized protein n=1 Tax=Palleronia aestuarii TaxID=568105 RepID=A0A2W7NA27_9RHOB|nr:hypothetical protein LX81_01862 [Palleronia aestuarii]